MSWVDLVVSVRQESTLLLLLLLLPYRRIRIIRAF